MQILSNIVGQVSEIGLIKVKTRLDVKYFVFYPRRGALPATTYIDMPYRVHKA